MALYLSNKLETLKTRKKVTATKSLIKLSEAYLLRKKNLGKISKRPGIDDFGKQYWSRG